MSDSEINLYKQVQNKELNDLFQEVRSLDDKFLLAERHIHRRTWFKKPKVETYYSLYINTGHGDVQVMNWAREWRWSINTEVPASYIYAYFYGILGGVQLSKKITP